jgi:hypothetical protein
MSSSVSGFSRSRTVQKFNSALVSREVIYCLKIVAYIIFWWCANKTYIQAAKAQVHGHQKLQHPRTQPHNMTFNVNMAADLNTVVQLLQATLDPRQHKQGTSSTNSSMACLLILTITS